MRRQVNEASRLAYQLRGLPNHPCHEELKTIKKDYTERIETTKKQHWTDWLENLEGNDIWTVNRYISSEPKDGGKARIPTLKTKNPDGSIAEASTNHKKSLQIAKSFFPPPPTDDPVPADNVYPEPVEPHTPFTEAEILRAISRLNGLKAPGPDGI